MSLHLSVYLAGNIQKGQKEESSLFWTLEDQKAIQEALSPHSVTILNPALRTDGLFDRFYAIM